MFKMAKRSEKLFCIRNERSRCIGHIHIDLAQKNKIFSVFTGLLLNNFILKEIYKDDVAFLNAFVRSIQNDNARN